MISDDMSDDKIKSDLGKSLAIMNVNGFLTPGKGRFQLGRPHRAQKFLLFR